MKTMISIISNEKKEFNLFKEEHGLSLVIEYNNQKYIFDTGQSNAFIKNAKACNIDLDNIENVIISHGHYDHIGGLEFLKNKTVYMNKHAFNAKCKKANEQYINIGTKFSQTQYENKNKHNFKFINQTTKINENIYLFSTFKYKNTDDYFFVKKEIHYVSDDFKDEIVLVINGAEGLDIITGCSHCGIINIINSIKKEFPNTAINSVTGGFHLSKESDSQIKKTALALKKLKIKKIKPLHCSGDKIINFLK